MQSGECTHNQQTAQFLKFKDELLLQRNYETTWQGNDDCGTNGTLNIIKQIAVINGFK